MKESEDQDNSVNSSRDNSILFYKKKDFKQMFPNLFQEIEENTVEVVSSERIDDDLKNPGVNDFIRRCSNRKEALEILEYLYKRKELSYEDFSRLKLEVSSEEKFKLCIDKLGGFKKKGYYIDKYYSKNI